MTLHGATCRSEIGEPGRPPATISSFLDWWLILDLWPSCLVVCVLAIAQAAPVCRAVVDRILRLPNKRAAKTEPIHKFSLFLLSVVRSREAHCVADSSEKTHALSLLIAASSVIHKALQNPHNSSVLAPQQKMPRLFHHPQRSGPPGSRSAGEYSVAAARRHGSQKVCQFYPKCPLLVSFPARAYASHYLLDLALLNEHTVLIQEELVIVRGHIGIDTHAVGRFIPGCPSDLLVFLLLVFSIGRFITRDLLDLRHSRDERHTPCISMHPQHKTPHALQLCISLLDGLIKVGTTSQAMQRTLGLKVGHKRGINMHNCS